MNMKKKGRAGVVTPNRFCFIVFAQEAAHNRSVAQRILNEGLHTSRQNIGSVKHLLHRRQVIEAAAQC